MCNQTRLVSEPKEPSKLSPVKTLIELELNIFVANSTCHSYVWRGELSQGHLVELGSAQGYIYVYTGIWNK